MKLVYVLLVTAFFVAPAFAQQQLSPEQAIASQLGSQLGLCFHGNAALQTQLAAAQAEIKALKDKYEKPEEKK